MSKPTATEKAIAALEIQQADIQRAMATVNLLKDSGTNEALIEDAMGHLRRELADRDRAIAALRSVDPVAAPTGAPKRTRRKRGMPVESSL